MRIIKANEAITVEHPVICIFGQPGIGKSTLGYSGRDTFCLDFDSGAHRAKNRRDTLVIEKWDDVVEVMGRADILANYGSFSIDTVGRCLDVMTADIIAKQPKLGRDGNLTQQGWGALKSRFRGWIAQLRTLGKDVILISHHKEDKDGELTVVRPDITGGSYGEVMKTADLVGFLYMNGRDRVLDFSPTDRWVGKNPAGWAPLTVPHYVKTQTFIADLLDQAREALGHISEESAKVAEQVAEWRANIDTFTSAEECTRAIVDIAKLPTVVAPQVKKLLMDRSKTLNLTFDTKKKAFIEAAEPVAVGA